MSNKIKKPIFKRWWFWLIIVVIGIAALGANGGKDEPKKVGEATTSAKADDKKKNEPQLFKVGDVVELKNFKVTVNKVYNVKGDEFSKPKDGNEFLAIDCTLENISDKDQAVSSIMMFKVVDKDGRAAEYSITGQVAAKAGQLDGTIAPGRKLTGVYVVEVPKGATGLELEFDSSFIAGTKVIVKLN